MLEKLRAAKESYMMVVCGWNGRTSVHRRCQSSLESPNIPESDTFDAAMATVPAQYMRGGPKCFQHMPMKERDSVRVLQLSRIAMGVVKDIMLDVRFCNRR